MIAGIQKIATLLAALIFSSPLAAIEVPLVKEGGVYTVPVRINDVLTLDFVIDSGAAEVQVPADVALTLFRTGTITEEDFLPGQTYRLADGSTMKSGRFMIKELRIGPLSIKQVEAGVTPVQGSLLLGQSFLSKVSSWSQDNKRGVLVIGNDDGNHGSSKPPHGKIKARLADWGNDVWALALETDCEIGEFQDKGLNKSIIATIPASRLNQQAESWGIFENRAITVKGCWSSRDNQSAKAILRRKKDGKTWMQDLKFDDGTWQDID